MFNFIFVALGGALGAMGRYAISLVPVKSFFPFLTLVTNIGGAVVIGFIAGAVSVKEGTPPGLVLFLKVGVCGGFTTFSTFSLELFNLLEQGKAAARCPLRRAQRGLLRFERLSGTDDGGQNFSLTAGKFFADEEAAERDGRTLPILHCRIGFFVVS